SPHQNSKDAANQARLVWSPPLHSRFVCNVREALVPLRREALVSPPTAQDLPITDELTKGNPVQIGFFRMYDRPDRQRRMNAWSRHRHVPHEIVISSFQVPVGVNLMGNDRMVYTPYLRILLIQTSPST